jgi:hypothetical protein
MELFFNRTNSHIFFILWKGADIMDHPPSPSSGGMEFRSMAMIPKKRGEKRSLMSVR